MARTLTLTKDQFDALYELLDETITDISSDLDLDLIDLNDIEIYQVFQKLKTINYVESNQLSDDDYAPIIINLPEGTNLTRVIRSDDDYASKVDTLVDNMVASDDNLFTHDSEGC